MLHHHDVRQFSSEALVIALRQVVFADYLGRGAFEENGIAMPEKKSARLITDVLDRIVILPLIRIISSGLFILKYDKTAAVSLSLFMP